MWFLLRMTFWLGLVLVLLPPVCKATAAPVTGGAIAALAHRCPFRKFHPGQIRVLKAESAHHQIRCMQFCALWIIVVNLFKRAGEARHSPGPTGSDT
jgi:hypothetical protein